LWNFNVILVSNDLPMILMGDHYEKC